MIYPHSPSPPGLRLSGQDCGFIYIPSVDRAVARAVARARARAVASAVSSAVAVSRARAVARAVARARAVAVASAVAAYSLISHSLIPAILALAFSVHSIISITSVNSILSTVHVNLQFCGFVTPDFAICSSVAAPSQ